MPMKSISTFDLRIIRWQTWMIVLSAFAGGFLIALLFFGELSDIGNLLIRGTPGTGTVLPQRWRLMTKACTGDQNATIATSTYLRDHSETETYLFWVDVLEINERNSTPGIYRNAPHSKIFREFSKQLINHLCEPISDKMK